jgi:hypothetical protein
MNCNTQNAKIASITEKTLIVGIDVGSETHYARAFDWRNYEYSKKPLEFSNTEAGFMTFKAWVEDIAEKQGKTAVIPNRTLLVCTGKIPAGQWNEACSCESSSCQEVKRTG